MGIEISGEAAAFVLMAGIVVIALGALMLTRFVKR
jgi:hypothetical protein